MYIYCEHIFNIHNQIMNSLLSDEIFRLADIGMLDNTPQYPNKSITIMNNIVYIWSYGINGFIGYKQDKNIYNELRY